MRQIILASLRQLRDGIAAGRKTDLSGLRAAKQVVICGMGGSAAAGDLLRLLLRHDRQSLSEAEVIVHRSYNLPALRYPAPKPPPLIVAISHSGNTEETLSAYREAQRRRLPLLALATGGRLRRRALADGVPLAQIPATGVPPRLAIGYHFGALTTLLARLGMVRRMEKNLLALERNVRPAKFERQGRRIAQDLEGAVPLIYASENWKELAYLLKGKINEHAKYPAFWNFFPELNHNELAGFAEHRKKSPNRAQFHLLLLQDRADHARINRRIRLTATLLKARGTKSTLLPLPGKTTLEKMFSALIVGDWIGYHLALRRGVDSSPVALIESFKELLKR